MRIGEGGFRIGMMEVRRFLAAGEWFGRVTVSLRDKVISSEVEKISDARRLNLCCWLVLGAGGVGWG